MGWFDWLFENEVDPRIEMVETVINAAHERLLDEAHVLVDEIRDSLEIIKNVATNTRDDW